MARKNKEKRTYITETNQNIIDLVFINFILCKMYESPFPVTPRELTHWEELEIDDVEEAESILIYMEAKEYIKNIGTLRKPVFELAPYGITIVDIIKNS